VDAMRIRQFINDSIAISVLVVVMAAGCDRHVNLGPVADASNVDAIRKAFTSGKAAGAQKKAGPVGTGWATLRGQFVYTGEKPQMPPYEVNKETEFCTINGVAPKKETLLVDDGSKGIKNVVVFLREASRVNDSAKPKTDTVVFDQKTCVFLTHVLGITVGEKLQIKNSDPTGHNTNIAAWGYNPTVAAGASADYTVQKDMSQPNPVKCGIHSWMTAYILARKDGYFAVTDKDGKFEIANLPADEPIELQVWHESGAAPGNGLVGTTSDGDVKWTNRGRMTLVLKKDQPREIKVTCAPKAFQL
jgi:hypothetical protein